MNSWPRKWVVLCPLGRLEHRDAVTSLSRAQSCVGCLGQRGFLPSSLGYLVPFMTGSVTGDTPWSHHPWREDALPWPCWAPSQPLSSAHFKCSALSKEGLPPPPCAALTRITAFNLLKQSKTKKPTQQQQQQQKSTHKKTHTQK